MPGNGARKRRTVPDITLPVPGRNLPQTVCCCLAAVTGKRCCSQCCASGVRRRSPADGLLLARPDHSPVTVASERHAVRKCRASGVRRRSLADSVPLARLLPWRPVAVAGKWHAIAMSLSRRPVTVASKRHALIRVAFTSARRKVAVRDAVNPGGSGQWTPRPMAVSHDQRLGRCSHDLC